MKKNILLVLFVYFNFSGLVNAAMPSINACTISGDETTFPSSGGGMCSGQPDTYKLTIYEMKLCTSAITAPTTSSAVGTTSCQAVLTNANATAMTITKGGSAAISGSIVRPPNGSYTHGYVLLSNTLTILDSRKFDTSLDEENDGDADGKYCVTTSSGIDCSTTDNLTAAEQSMSLGATHMTGYVSGNSTIAGYGIMNAYLVDINKKLEADTDADVVYIVGQLAFTTPVVITDNTSSMSISLDVSNGVMYSNNDGGTPPSVGVYVGPFMLRMSVE